MLKQKDLDPHLLLGLLALNNKFIERAPFLAALKLWQADPSKALGPILIERKVVHARDLELFQPLLQAHLDRKGNDLATFGYGHSAEEIIQTLDHLDWLDSEKYPSDEWHVNGVPRQQILSAQTDYEVLGLQAEGAIGQVSVAFDQQLSREVALKELKPNHANDPVYQARFRLEAEINGGLEHPNIVPVYDLGTYADGRPYYAMRNVRGESLQAAIDRLHQPGKEKLLPAEWNLQMQELLRSFVAVCQAIDYAHSRCVLHRDLKPANIMLGAYGETLVVDWGVAKTIDGLSEPDSEEIKLIPPSIEHSMPTQVGAVVGTPGYMSPEQATGGMEQSTATDIYSLGATLYTILTGQRAYAYQENILQRIQNGLFPRPSQVKADVPPALEAVCLKAMALQPKHRYPSARDLAEEIKQWLANGKVSVYRDPWNVRLGQWSWRQRTLISSLAALLLTTLVATLVGLYLLKQEGTNTKTQRDIALQEKNQAQQQLLRANRTDYRNKVLLAQEEWNQRRPDLAWNQLKRCPANLRGWEHAYLATWFHQSTNILWASKGNGPSRLALSADGKRMARSYSDSRIDVWDMEDERYRFSLDTGQNGVSCLELMPDSTRLVAGFSSGGVTIWDLNRKTDPIQLPGHANYVYCLAVSPDGQWIASGGKDNQIRIWDAKTGSEITRLEGHTSWVTSLKFDADGKRLLSGCKDGSIKIWDPCSWKVVKTLTDHKSMINTLAFSPDGKQFASASFDKTVKTWDFEQEAPLNTFSGPPLGGIRLLAYSADSQRLVGFSFDRTIKLWDCTKGTEIFTIKGSNYLSASLAVYAVGNRLNFGALDHLFKVWDETSNRGVLDLTGHTGLVNSMAFSPDGETIVSGGNDNNLIVWNTRTGQPRMKMKGHDQFITCVAYHLNGKQFASGSLDHTIKIWDAASGIAITTIRGNTKAISHLAFSPNGKTLVSGCKDNRLSLWDSQTGERLRVLEGHRAPVTCLSFSSSGHQLISGSLDSNLILWDTDSGKPIFTLKGHSQQISCLAISPDGERVVSGSWDNTLILWDASTGKPISKMNGHTDAITAVAFSPDGLTIASGSKDQTVMIWNGLDGSRKTIFDNNQSEVSCLTFNSQGDRLFIGSTAPDIKVLDVASGQPLLFLPAPSAPVLGLALSPDGKRLISRNANGGALTLWDASWEDCPVESSSD